MQIIKEIIRYSLSKFDLKISNANQNLQQIFFQLQNKEITNNSNSKDYFISDNNEKTVYKSKLPLYSKTLLESVSYFNSFKSLTK